MNIRFSTETNPILAGIVNHIDTTLECSKFQEYKCLIDIDTWENIGFSMPHNKKIAENGFGFCITNYREYGELKRMIVINMENCKIASFTEREITAIIFHELGHLLNRPELTQEPTMLYCMKNEVNYNSILHEEIRTENAIQMEIFADSYANQHGYGDELVSTFHKQNRLFDQKIGYLDERLQNIDSK
jgi:hypothetical protein